MGAVEVDQVDQVDQGKLSLTRGGSRWSRWSITFYY